MLGALASRLEHYLDVLSARQQLIAANVANADTPGYRAVDLNFAEEFRRGVEPGANGLAEATAAAQARAVSLSLLPRVPPSAGSPATPRDGVPSAPGPYTPHVLERGDGQVKNDGNDVSLDREMRLLGENTLRFQMASQLLRGEVMAMRRALTEGRE
jgi:flagellar basal-body rod protein FlgB